MRARSIRRLGSESSCPRPENRSPLFFFSFLFSGAENAKRMEFGRPFSSEALVASLLVATSVCARAQISCSSGETLYVPLWDGGLLLPTLDRQTLDVS